MLNKMSQEIEERALKCGSYMDAVLDYVEECKICDVEDVVEVLHPTIIEKIKIEAISKNHIRGVKIENTLDDFS